MADAVAEFFEDLGRRGREPLLDKATGTVRFDVAEGTKTERWLVSVNRGAIAVSRRKGKADCVIRAEAPLVEALVRGEQNALAAFLRGAMTFEGDPGLLVTFQRLFPGPAAGSRGPAARAAQA